MIIFVLQPSSLNNIDKLKFLVGHICPALKRLKTTVIVVIHNEMGVKTIFFIRDI